MGDGPIAYICPQRQIHVISANGVHTPQTTAESADLVWGSWSGRPAQSIGHSWPTWSPSGTHIACFRIPQGGTPRVLVLEVDGIESAELVDLGARLPIYLFWSPSGKQLAVLTQYLDDNGDKLGLSCLRPDVMGVERQIADGTPLFFTWIGERLATYVGSGNRHGSRLCVTDPGGHSSVDVLPAIPSNFCAPIAFQDRLLYVGRHQGATHIMHATIGDSQPTLVEAVDGLVGLVASPDRRLVARAIAPGGDGTPYRDLAILDLVSGAIREVVDLPCLGYFWTPDSQALVVVSVDTSRNLMTWSTVSLDGDIDPIAEMVPTRDFGFYLRFFEQYSQSHPIISPTSTQLMVSGEVKAVQGQGKDIGLWEIPLNGATPTRIGDGVFGVYGPTKTG